MQHLVTVLQCVECGDRDQGSDLDLGGSRTYTEAEVAETRWRGTNLKGSKIFTNTPRNCDGSQECEGKPWDTAGDEEKQPGPQILSDKELLSCWVQRVTSEDTSWDSRQPGDQGRLCWEMPASFKLPWEALHGAFPTKAL